MTEDPDEPIYEIRDPEGNVTGYVYDVADVDPPDPPDPVDPPDPDDDYPLPEPPASAVRKLCTSTDDLRSKIGSAKPGDVLLLKEGVKFGFTAKYGFKNWGSNPIWIMSEDRSNPSVCKENFIDFNDSSGVILADINFLSERPPGSVGEPTGDAIKASKCSNFAVQNCKFKGYNFQIGWRFMTDIRLQWNTHEGCGQDNIRLFETIDGALIENIKSGPHKPTSNQEWIQGHHLDHMQFAVNGSYPGAKNVTIRKCQLLVDIPNLYCQGIAIFSEWVTSHANEWPKMAHTNILVEDNYIEMAHVNAAAVMGCKGYKARRNVFRQTKGSDQSTTHKPTFNLYSQGHINEDLDIQDNVVWSPINYQPPQPSSGPKFTGTVENNVVSQTAVPQGWVKPKVGQFGWRG